MPLPLEVEPAVDPYLALLERFRELHGRIERHMTETERKLDVLFSERMAARVFRQYTDPPGPDVVIYRPDGVTPRWQGSSQEIAEQVREEFYGRAAPHQEEARP